MCGIFGALLHVWNHAAMKGLMFLCAGGVDRIVHDDSHDELRHTNEIEMIDTLEREPHRDVVLHRIASGPGWQVDAVDRTGCTTPS